MAPGMFLAHSVVPSSGSTAMSTFGPPLQPTFSPMNSIGASSISPSPITTVPSIGSLLSSRRMASTAAWSAAFSSPRPRSRAAATAARSVTRTISIERMRSSIEVVRNSDRRHRLLPPKHPRNGRRGLILLDADHLRPAGDYTVAAHRGEGLAHGVLAGRVGDQDHRNRLRPSGRTARAVGACCRGAARSTPAKCSAAPAAARWSPRCRAGRGPAGGCSSRPRGAASAPCGSRSCAPPDARTARCARRGRYRRYRRRPRTRSPCRRRRGRPA